MNFTKAQSAILEEVGNTGVIVNYMQRMRAIQPLLDAGIIKQNLIVDDKLGYAVDCRWELI